MNATSNYISTWHAIHSVNPAHRVVSVRDNPVFRRQGGTPTNARLMDTVVSFLGYEGDLYKDFLGVTPKTGVVG